jgi:hypothetical protein
MQREHTPLTDSEDLAVTAPPPFSQPSTRAELIAGVAARQLLREVLAMGDAALAAGETFTPEASELYAKIGAVLRGRP